MALTYPSTARYLKAQTFEEEKTYSGIPRFLVVKKYSEALLFLEEKTYSGIPWFLVAKKYSEALLFPKRKAPAHLEHGIS